ncbi:LysR family transcriptional regulator [Roseivivax sp. CAU 1761]
MNLGLLEDFLELARQLNFSRAAEARGTTQPAFSRRIRSLEAALGTALVTRSTRSVTLTAAGRAFEPRARGLVRGLAEARAEALEAVGQSQRSLTLAATHALSYTFVPRWLLSIDGPTGTGALNMVSDSHRQCRRLMQGGEAQFFICHKAPTEAEGLPERQFRSHAIGADRLVPLCAPGADGGPRWRLGTGPAAPGLAYAAASGLSAILEAHWARTGAPGLTPVLHSVLAATNLEMAKQGQGVAFLPLSLAEADLARGTLVRAGNAGFEVPVEVVIYRPRARMSPHCEAFWQRATDPAINARRA